MIEFALETGARVSEVAGVRICDVRAPKTKRIFHKSYTKRNKTRPLHIADDLYKEMISFI